MQRRADPCTRAAAAPPLQAPTCGGQQRPSVLLVGHPGLGLKGFDCAIATLALVNRSRPVEVHWVCQQQPSEHLAAQIAASGLEVQLHVNPPQVG